MFRKLFGFKQKPQLNLKALLLKAIESDEYGVYPYSSTETFDLSQSETMEYSIFKVPVEFVDSLESFATQSYLPIFGKPQKEYYSYIDISYSNIEVIAQHLKWIAVSYEPKLLKYMEVAIEESKGYHNVIEIRGHDDCISLMVAKSEHFYTRFMWYTTG